MSRKRTADFSPYPYPSPPFAFLFQPIRQPSYESFRVISPLEFPDQDSILVTGVSGFLYPVLCQNRVFGELRFPVEIKRSQDEPTERIVAYFIVNDVE